MNGDGPWAGIAMVADRLAATVTICLVGLVFWIVDRPDRAYAWIGMLGLAFFVASFPTMLVFGRGPVRFLEPLTRSLLGRRHGALVQFRVLDTPGLAWIFLVPIAPHLIDACGFWMLARAMKVSKSLVTNSQKILNSRTCSAGANPTESSPSTPRRWIR